METASLRNPLCQASQVNEIWSLDYMSDSMTDGKMSRILNVIDDCNRDHFLNKGSITYHQNERLKIYKD